MIAVYVFAHQPPSYPFAWRNGQGVRCQICRRQVVRFSKPLTSLPGKGRSPREAGAKAADALETGKLLYVPHLPFELSGQERRFLSPVYLDGKSKNISFRPGSGVLRGTGCQGAERDAMLGMLTMLPDKDLPAC